MNSLRGRRVFVTGHTGFKGSWLCAWLLRDGAKVCGYALQPEGERPLFDVLNLRAGMESVIADVRDASGVQQAMQRFAPDVIFHLAAQPLVSAGYTDPLGTFSTNVQGTANVLAAARATPSVQAAIVVTTDKVYRDLQPGTFCSEDDALGGHDPYSASKACAEMVTSAYREAFFADGGIIVASARAGNVIGGGDRAKDRIIPDIVRAWSSGQKVALRHPQSVRPWQHVLDSLSGYRAISLRALEGDRSVAGAWNFGPTSRQTATVAEIVEMFAHYWPGAAGARVLPDAPFAESAWLGLNSAKAAEHLDWVARYDLQTAVRTTAQWYRAEHEGAAMQEFTMRQIDDFASLG